MAKISQSSKREIIEDFAKEIRSKRTRTSELWTINFRTERTSGEQREIWKVPIEVIRFRKDNGRIASDVSSYEATESDFKENDDATQKILRKFLEEKDPNNTDNLENIIFHEGQRDPAIITCDGFLIDGNRRKLVLENLSQKHPEKDAFKWMKVVILPDENEEGGPPTLIEIEQLENRYQLQKEGKSEYYKFDRALAIRRKIDIGLSLRAQVKDESAYARATEKEIKKAIDGLKKDYLKPLECVDKYLEQLGRAGQYRAISGGRADREGRWQAFVDWSASYENFKNPRKRLQMGIEETEVGKIETAAYHVIRLRNIPDMPKANDIMRNWPKYCETREGKKNILAIEEEVTPLSEEEWLDENGSPLSFSVLEEKWKAKNQEKIIWRLKEAEKFRQNKTDQETPLKLLEAALKKLNHDNMDLSGLRVGDYDEAREIAAQIQEKANEIEKEIYKKKKKYRNLETKK